LSNPTNCVQEQENLASLLEYRLFFQRLNPVCVLRPVLGKPSLVIRLALWLALFVLSSRGNHGALGHIARMSTSAISSCLKMFFVLEERPRGLR